ncbi:methyltransferase [Alsobacter sp. R-9]
MTTIPAVPPLAPPASLAERWYRLRDRLLRDPVFQRRAAAFPLTRWIARRRARESFDLVAGFVYAQILHAVVKLKVLETVAAGPVDLGAIAAATGLPLSSARKLCAGAAALRLLQERGGGYGLGDLGAALLGNAGVLAMVEHHAILYEDLQDPVGLLRDPSRPTKLSAYWAYATQDPATLTADKVADYSRLMAASQQFIAGEVLDAYPVAGHRRLLDVGGGEGAFIRAAARRAPALECMLFDVPPVADRATAAFAADGLAQRARAFGGNMFTDPLPQGADLVSLVRVLYDHPDDRVLTLLKATRAALAPGGTLIVAEPMAATPGAETVGAAYFGFYLMAMKGGESRSPDALAGLLRQAGFSQVDTRSTRSPLLTGLLVARP